MKTQVDTMNEPEIQDDKWHANKIRKLASELRYAVTAAQRTGLNVYADWQGVIEDDEIIEITRSL